MTDKSKIRLLAVIGTAAVSACAAGLFLSPASAAEGRATEPYAVAPEIVVDYNGYEENDVPNAVKNKPYALFDATATDLYDKDVEVEIAVYLYYYSENKSRFPVSDGFVTPVYEGVYTVEYTATDESGNVAVCTYDFACVEKKALSATLSATEGETTVGETTALADILFENSVGKTAFKAIATSADGKIVYELEEDETTFVPEYVGAYTVRYEYYDYNESGSVEYALTVKGSEAPKMKEEASLLSYFIVGCEYDLPVIDCVSYAIGKPMKITPKISVLYKEIGKTVYLADGKFTPERSGEISIVYEAEYGEKKTVKTYDAVAVDVGYGGSIRMQDYLYGENVATEATSYGVRVNACTENATATFINPVLTEELTTSLAVNPNKANFEKLNMYLTDSVNSAEKLKFTFEKNGDGGIFTVNDEVSTTIDYGFTVLRTVTLNYSDATRFVSFGESSEIEVETTLYGAAFKGFSSGTAYLTFEFEEVVSESQIIVYTVNNQALYNSAGDGVVPYVKFYKYAQGERRVGDVVTLERVFAQDVLDPDFNVVIAVKAPDGTFVDTKGNDLLSFKTTQIGTYNVVITASDSSNNEQKYSYSINVVDTTAPMIKLPLGLKDSVKLGASVNISKPAVSDNRTAKPEIYAYVVNPDYSVTELTIGKSFMPNQYGEHTVYYYAVDEDGNRSFAVYSFTVQ